jgi:hypothetical protein
MNYDENLAILDQLQGAHAEAFTPESPTHGAQVVPHEHEGTLEVLIAPGSEEERERWRRRLAPDQTFTYDYEGESRRIGTLIVTQERYRALAWRVPEIKPRPTAPPVKAGEYITAYVAGMWGTAGLNFLLDGVMSCISCWHVMCALLGETPTGPQTPVELRGLPDVAYLASYSRVHFDDDREHTWDLAIATYIDPRMAANVLAPCDDGTNPYPYPGVLATTPRAGTVYKVGAAAPVCMEAAFAGTTFTGRVDYPPYRPRFRGQLVFPQMTNPGDSGALAIYKDTSEILGLHFAIQNGTSLANPLYGIGWIYRGRQGGLPVFTTH